MMDKFITRRFFSDVRRSFFNSDKSTPYSKKHQYYTNLGDAVRYAAERRGDLDLKKRVDTFLQNDIPEHFVNEMPVLYLSRHIATPNFEALHFIAKGKEYNLPIIIGQDLGGKFTPNNPIKKSLGKMSIVSGMTRYSDEITENFTIIDFNKANGEPLSNIKTKFGENLSEFHNELLRLIYNNTTVVIADEEEWVNRNHRDNLVKQYEKILAINTYYGVLFESFPDSESDFFNDVFARAYDNISNILKAKPLVVELVSDHEEVEKNWEAYPSVVYAVVKEKFNGAVNNRD